MQKLILVVKSAASLMVLDGKDQGGVKPDQTSRITVNLGQHILKWAPLPKV